MKTVSAENIHVTHTFQPGKTYRAYPVVEGGAVRIEIREAAIPLLPGMRVGLFPGWLNSMENLPFGGLFLGAQAGVTTTGSIPIELMAEGSVGLGYSHFIVGGGQSVQWGGTANVYFFGKSEKKTGFGLGGVWSMTETESFGWTPYVRVSFFPYSKSNTRLFIDYSFTDEDMIKRLGVGWQFFLNE